MIHYLLAQPPVELNFAGSMPSDAGTMLDAILVVL